MNPYVFIVGSARSGTTLLQRMVDAHPQIAVVHETRWITRYFEKRTGLTSEGFVTPELIPKLLEHRRFPKMKISCEELEGLINSDEPVSYSSFVSALFDLYGQHEGKSLVGDKTPSYVLSLPTLHGLWPTAKFVHIIRDGRDACLSILNWLSGKAQVAARRRATWTEDPVLTTALWWKQRVRLGREDGSALGPGLYYEIRYETLVSQPATECAALCDFLGLPYDGAMLSFHEGREKEDPSLDAKKAWRPITPGLRDWRSQMTLGDIERFEAAAGDLLEELGYPRAVPELPQEMLEDATRIYHAFTEEIRAKGKRLPKRW
jgi:sulfotransferase family protein